jgi:hypothetical protein
MFQEKSEQSKIDNEHHQEEFHPLEVSDSLITQEA